MLDILYKFKSSLNFEKISLSESSVTVAELKELINKKQSIKTNGFDLKFTDSEGRVYAADNEIIDTKYKIIVSRCPKIVKPAVNNVRKKDNIPINKTNDIDSGANEIIIQVTSSSNSVIDTLSDSKEGSVEVDSSNVSVTESIIPSIPDYFKCSLCKNIMKDAMMINCCKKNFCYECITGYLFDPDISGAMECPDCKATVSNYGSNLIENKKHRGLISQFLNGTLDRTTCDMMYLKSNDKEEDHVNGVTSDINDTDLKDKMLFLDNADPISKEGQVSDDINNLYEDHLMNPISMDCDLPQRKDNLDYPIETKSSEIPKVDFSNEEQITFKKEITPTTISTETRDTKRKDRKEHDQKKVSSQKKRSSRGDQVNLSDSKVNTELKKVKELEFDPVLYMKFLKIVGESCPEELKKILSSNNMDTSHRTKDTKRTTTSKSKPKSRDDDYQDSSSKPPPQKKCRQENVVEGGSSEGRSSRHVYESKRDSHPDSHGYYNDQGRKHGSTSQHREQYNRDDNSGMSEIKSSRSKEITDHHRSKDFYPQQNNSRYGARSQFDSQPPPVVYGDRRRFKPDYCSSSSSFQTDKQKYGRRSDR